MKSLDTYHLDLARAALDKAVADLHVAQECLQDAGMEDDFWIYRGVSRNVSSIQNHTKYLLERRHDNVEKDGTK